MHSFWKQFTRWRQGRTSSVLATETMRLVKLTWNQSASDIWTAYGNITRYGYPVSMHLLVREQFIMCMATAELLIDRKWIQRDMPLLLLEENNHFAYGSFRLSERPDNMVELVHGHWVDAHLFNAPALANIVRMLIDQMQLMITVLYARDLIVAGRRHEPKANCHENVK